MVTAAHGVRGQVKILPFTDHPEALFAYSPITDHSGGRAFKLKREGIKDKLVIASIAGITDRNAAELLKGMELYAPAPTTQVNGPNQWSYTELTGLEARLIDGNVYGRVIGVYNFGAGDIIDIERQDGSSEMLPFNENFVGDVEVGEGSLVVYPPEYLEGGK